MYDPQEKEKQANGQEAKKAEAPVAAPTPVDKSKRARELLDTQLHQQRKLIQKLESGECAIYLCPSCCPHLHPRDWPPHSLVRLAPAFTRVVGPRQQKKS